jgi:hypothetical protein
MNLNDNPTIEQFRELLREHDDRAGHHVLWVRKDGEVMLTCLPRSNPRKPPTHEHPEMQMRYDTFPVGYGYVGHQPPEENDGWFLGELYKHMLEQWCSLKGTAIMTHLDLDSVAPQGRPVDEEEMAELKRIKEEILRQEQARRSGCCPRSDQ